MREDMVRLHLVEMDYYKILEPLKGAPNLTIFTQKRFLVVGATWKSISKIMKHTKIFWGRGHSDPQENKVMWP